MSTAEKRPDDDRPIKTTTYELRRVVMMPRGNKNTAERVTRITLPRVSFTEDKP